MPGATLAEIRAGLETRLATIPDVTTSAYMLPDPPSKTMQVMGPSRVEYDQAGMRGLDYWTFIIQCFSGSWESRAAQETLDDWLAPAGANSVKAAIEGDRTLGGIVDDCVIQSASGYMQYLVGPSGGTKREVLGVDFTALILNSGT
jgi:hypothetical protein